MYKRRRGFNRKNASSKHKKYLLNKKKYKKTELPPMYDTFFDVLKPPEGQANGSIKFNWTILILFVPFLIYFLNFINNEFVTYILLVYSAIMVIIHITIIYFFYKELGNLINPQHLILNSLLLFALTIIYSGITFFYMWIIDHSAFTGPTKVLTVFDMIYYSFVTVATLGYGDILPNSTLTKILAIFQILFGIWFLITVVPVLVADQAERLKDYRIKRKKLMEALKVAIKEGKLKNISSESKERNKL